MDSATLLTALLIVLALLAVAALVFRKRAPAKGPFCAGPSNIGLYDHPYDYPSYVARMATSWDHSRRCAAYCGIGDCAVWCR